MNDAFGEIECGDQSGSLEDRLAKMFSGFDKDH